MAIYRIPIEITSPYIPGGASNVWHARCPSAGNYEQMVDVLKNFYADLLVYYAQGTVINLGAGIDVETNEPAPEPTVPWAPLTAAATGGTTPPHLAICISWKTNQRTRRGTGRTFLGPLQQAGMQTDGTITDSWKTGIQTIVNQLIADIGAVGNGSLGVYGYQNPVPPGASRPPGDPRVIRDFTSGTIRDQWAVLRSRRN